jgi:hypothetical protein
MPIAIIERLSPELLGLLLDRDRVDVRRCRRVRDRRADPPGLVDQLVEQD